ncbi:MAG: hypothetical protein ACAH11_03955 [Sphingomonas sp.]
MPKLFQIAIALSLCALAAPAEARIPAKRFDRIALGGVRLGMPFSRAEAMLRARRDWSEPRATLGANFDCGSLAPDSQAAPFDPNAAPRLPNGLSFSDSAHREWGLGFSPTPGGAILTRVYYRDWGIKTGWRAYLARMALSYGEPDQVTRGKDGMIEALWCEESGQPCDGQTGDKGSLSLTWYPDFTVLEGDGIVHGAAATFNLDEGSDRSRARDDKVKARAARDPAAARALHAQCLSPAGKFADDQAVQQHALGLVRYFPGESATIWSPHQVPNGVWAAMGIDPKLTFGEGVCFNGSDVMFEDPACPGGMTHIGFRWARHAGKRWLVAMRYGGAALQRRFHVIEEQPDGSFRLIWWNRDLAPLSRWLDAGATPMILPRR